MRILSPRQEQLKSSVGSASGCLLMFSLFTCASLGTVMRSATAPEARILVPKESKSRIPELDGLRGLAILLVLLYHFVSSPRIQPPLFHKLFAIGWSGVDLFFVLSGFLIGGILLDVRESPNYFRTFYGRRFYRIVPLYYLWIGAYFVIALFWFKPISMALYPGLRVIPAKLHKNRSRSHRRGMAWSPVVPGGRGAVLSDRSNGRSVPYEAKTAPYAL